ncbi:MAG: IS630 family transposase [Gaiellaceae bacterium]
MDIALEAPQTVIMPEDETSLYLQATTQAVWAPRGQTPVVRVHPNREKVSFYGTLNLKTGQDIVMRSDVMNSQASARHLEQILDSVPDVPILVLWDRAPWHRGQPIRDVRSANPRLEIMYFPVAAPDLNPQEHIWKATRRAVSHNHLMPKLPELAERFERHLTTTTFESSFLERYGFNTVCSLFN